jgi:hypothetical protein
VAPSVTPAVRVPGGTKVDGELRYARTCYGHLAGILGTWLHDRLVATRAIDAAAGVRCDIGLTSALDAALAALGIGAAPLPRSRALGARICAHLLAEGWVERADGTRALTLTEAGRQELWRALGPLP